MEDLVSEFAQAVRNVRIRDEKLDQAKQAHTEIRELLEADAELRDCGIDTILIGSYARLTARYPGKDVDIFLRFTERSVRHAPEKIYNAVERVLVATYGLKEEDAHGRVTRQPRSLKIDFATSGDPTGEDFFSIDAVPAVRWHEHWGIPNRDRNEWDKEERRWIKTNPIKFAEDTNGLATATWSPTVAGANAYRPVARLLRQVRHVHLGDQRPGGLFTEVAAYYAWKDQLVVGTSWAELLAATLEQVAGRFSECAESGLLDPVFGTPMTPAVEPRQWMIAADVFNGLAERARQALDAERCMAAKIWRDILGTNDRGQVLPLPGGCDANGFPISAITAVSGVGSNEPRGFAGSAPLTHSRCRRSK
ncbi:nucleotidyltransferase domain-containing protein [Crossiella cryophila]|uniref:Putative nucleotidyltransferase n=1 Tax=Crossiella cryophila TaxID=43355 RepID=A0A7W7CA92_9PSEU|nr:nucleotidyltransferase [Crossiella cryophila]MBB4677440.1 putative nucleotidyltransferase [Crossiella cryophila]